MLYINILGICLGVMKCSVPPFMNTMNEFTARFLQIYTTTHLNKIKHDCQPLLHKSQVMCMAVLESSFSFPHSGKVYRDESSVTAVSAEKLLIETREIRG